MTEPYGILAEYADAAALVAAARRLREAGYRRFEAYSPYPVDALDSVAAEPARRLPATMAAAGIAGAAAGYLLQYWGAVIDYPLNIGGRPLDSWPAFVPACFEFGVIWAVAAGFLAFFAICRLPRLAHPIDRVPGFARASQDRFFLCVERQDPMFDRIRAEALLTAGAVAAPVAVAP